MKITLIVLGILVLVPVAAVWGWLNGMVIGGAL